MAKRQGTIAAAEHRIEDFAEDLGKMLGHARNKAEGWLGQRDAIVKSLTQLRDEATKLLAQLGHEAETVVRRRRPAVAWGSGSSGRRRNSVGLVVNKLRGGRAHAAEDVEGCAGGDFCRSEGAVGEGEGR